MICHKIGHTYTGHAVIEGVVAPQERAAVGVAHEPLGLTVFFQSKERQCDTGRTGENTWRQVLRFDVGDLPHEAIQRWFRNIEPAFFQRVDDPCGPETKPERVCMQREWIRWKQRKFV